MHLKNQKNLHNLNDDHGDFVIAALITFQPCALSSKERAQTFLVFEVVFPDKSQCLHACADRPSVTLQIVRALSSRSPGAVLT